MNLKYLINIFLIIFVIHIVLINLDFNLKIGHVKAEHFTNSKNQPTPNVNFLMGNSEGNDEFQQKLMKYMQVDVKQPTITEFEKKNTSEVKPMDEYASDNNVPNFESNVLDFSKFYNVSFDNMSENDLKKATPICNTASERASKPAEISGNDSMCDEKTVRQAQELPVSWQYKNELPMNGGAMNGIVGFDSLESQFSSFSGMNMDLQPSDDNNFKNIPHDDLRKPIVYN
jgi:hypothetical protein